MIALGSLVCYKHNKFKVGLVIATTLIRAMYRVVVVLWCDGKTTDEFTDELIDIICSKEMIE